MADVFKVLRGIMGDLFQIGGPVGPNVKNNSDTALELRNAADAAFVTGRGLEIQSGAGLNDFVTLLDLQGRVPNITFSFDGASPPSAGTNSGAFGLCHTAGGGYSEGDVVYDSGTALIAIPSEVVRTLTTGSAVTGDLSLIANGLYAWQGGTWVLKGDGTPVYTGVELCIEVVIGTNASYSSTTSIPDGARVTRTEILVETAYDSGTECTVIVDGTSDETLMSAADSLMSAVNQYESDEIHTIDATTEGLVAVNITNTPAAGAGRVLVFYCTPSA